MGFSYYMCESIGTDIVQEPIAHTAAHTVGARFQFPWEHLKHGLLVDLGSCEHHVVGVQA